MGLTLEELMTLASAVKLSGRPLRTKQCSGPPLDILRGAHSEPAYSAVASSLCSPAPGP